MLCQANLSCMVSHVLLLIISIKYIKWYIIKLIYLDDISLALSQYNVWFSLISKTYLLWTLSYYFFISRLEKEEMACTMKMVKFKALQQTTDQWHLMQNREFEIVLIACRNKNIYRWVLNNTLLHVILSSSGKHL